MTKKIFRKISDMNKATCIRVMECEIIKEEQSDCSKGFGADGQSDALDISLVKLDEISMGTLRSRTSRYIT